MPSMELENWMITEDDIKYVDLDSFIFCEHTSCFFKQMEKYKKLETTVYSNKHTHFDVS